MVFFILLGGTLLVFEVVKPDITYIEAKEKIEEKYNASIVTECPKTILTMNEKQIYRFFTHDDKTFSFDPYKNEIEQLTGNGFGEIGMCE